jgi:hypothetical protein
MQRERENFDGQRIRVKWDTGVTDYAYPPEIEILGQDKVSTGCN